MFLIIHVFYIFDLTCCFTTFPTSTKSVSIDFIIKDTNFDSYDEQEIIEYENRYGYAHKIHFDAATLTMTEAELSKNTGKSAKGSLWYNIELHFTTDNKFVKYEALDNILTSFFHLVLVADDSVADPFLVYEAVVVAVWHYERHQLIKEIKNS